MIIETKTTPKNPARKPAEYFVAKTSIMRTIWGSADTVLFIFAGAAAEFALNKAVDWLYFTGKLPADPLGRLFSTVGYARQIIFSSTEDALKAIDSVTNIHKAVEGSRGATIPDWAYRDVLFMLVHYSITSFELLERKLTNSEKTEVYQVFFRLGERMGLKELPLNYNEWLSERARHLMNDLRKSEHTNDLFKQYRKHLGFVRFKILTGVQKLIVPDGVKQLLKMNHFSVLRYAISVYKLSKKLGLDRPLKNILLPEQFKTQIMELDIKNR